MRVSHTRLRETASPAGAGVGTRAYIQEIGQNHEQFGRLNSAPAKLDWLINLDVLMAPK